MQLSSLKNTILDRRCMQCKTAVNFNQTSNNRRIFFFNGLVQVDHCAQYHLVSLTIFLDGYLRIIQYLNAGATICTDSGRPRLFWKKNIFQRTANIEISSLLMVICNQPCIRAWCPSPPLPLLDRILVLARPAQSTIRSGMIKKVSCHESARASLIC